MSEQDSDTSDGSAINVLDIAAEIVAAYLSSHFVSAATIPSLLASVHDALTKLGSEPAPEPPAPILKPAVPIKRSFHDDYVVCLEDGKKVKSLRRHLMTAHHLTLTQYRERWGLPADHPMVAPSYSALRSKLAKSMNFGGNTVKRRQATQSTPTEPANEGTGAAATGTGKTSSRPHAVATTSTKKPSTRAKLSQPT